MCAVRSLVTAAAVALAITWALPASAQGPGGYFGPRPERKEPAAAPSQPAVPVPGTGSYFGPRAAAPPAESTGTPAAPTLGAREAPMFQMPRWVRSVLTQVAQVQRRINAALTGEIRRLGTPDFWAAAGTLFLLSFLYGVFHAVGPGHGKVITTAYLATRNARFRHALLMCGANALAQAFTAILLVGGFAVVVDLGSEWILGRSLWLEHLSYALIALVGAVILYNALMNREHSHGRAHADGSAPGYAAVRGGDPSTAELVSAAVAVGIRPCSGAILVLLFTLAHGVFGIGVLATLLMGVGVALTLSVMGAATVGARVAVASLVAENSRLAHVGARVMRFGAGALLMLLGGLLLWASLLQGSLGG